MTLHIFKLGGSLTESVILTDWLDLIVNGYQGTAVIVPGGGAFAEQVRIAQQQWKFDDVVAHQMAILAMQQTALLFHGINRKIPVVQSAEEIHNSLHQHRVVIWSPEIKWLDACGVPASWEITSDSLAAWLGIKLSATKLVMVKSGPIPRAYSLAELATLGVVDAAFYGYCKQANYAIEFFNRNDVYHINTKKLNANDRLPS
jgi:aspartokinase-like uncharacterized kinase